MEIEKEVLANTTIRVDKRNPEKCFSEHEQGSCRHLSLGYCNLFGAHLISGEEGRGWKRWFECLSLDSDCLQLRVGTEIEWIGK